jgi:hypothetical protein
MRSTARLGQAVLLLLAVLAAGCGSDESPADGPGREAGGRGGTRAEAATAVLAAAARGDRAAVAAAYLPLEALLAIGTAMGQGVPAEALPTFRAQWERDRDALVARLLERMAGRDVAALAVQDLADGRFSDEEKAEIRRMGVGDEHGDVRATGEGGFEVSLRLFRHAGAFHVVEVR